MSPLSIAAGTRLGPYEVLAPLGAGGMGEVYRARDLRLNRLVAIKVLPTHLAADPQMRERFDREARAISQVAHPHICSLFDLGHQDGIDYLVMEYLEGQTLADVLRRGPLPVEDVLRYGTDIAGALSEAHRHGIVHRDLKPGNVMVTRAGVKVLDFGLATYVMPPAIPTGNAPEEETKHKPLTGEGVSVGTLQYMSPEQVVGDAVDPRSDLFALGTILYEMSTGRRAFDGTSRAALAAAILEQTPPAISSVQPLTPPALEQLVRRCLAKNPDDRFQTARDLQFALEQVSDQTRSGGVLGPGPHRKTAPGRTAMWIAAGAIAIAIAGIAIGWFVTQRRERASGLATARTIAVLPLANLGLEPGQDYLRLAIADEITTILSANQRLTVRPFSVSGRLRPDVDPLNASQKLNAARIISGNVRAQGGQLFVSLEGIDAQENKLFWRDSFETASGDLLTMRGELSSRIREGLMPRLAPASAPEEASLPKSQEAYALYLRAVGMSSDAAPTAEALRLLEEAVRVDPGYAPAWAALSRRAYFVYSYSGGGSEAFRRSIEAAQRALQLDPGMIDAAAQLVTIRAEGGETVQAWRDATALVGRRPDSARAHLALSYVLRYGGALNESAQQCEVAWRLDRHPALRSCALTFQMLQNYRRAEDFALLDPGSDYADALIATIRMRQGKFDEARRILGKRGGRLGLPILEEPADVDSAIERMMKRLTLRQDGEPYYNLALYAGSAGRPTRSLELLDEATRRNFCGYPAIDREPFLESVRREPAWAASRARAIACHETFMSAIASH